MIRSILETFYIDFKSVSVVSSGFLQAGYEKKELSLSDNSIWLFIKIVSDKFAGRGEPKI